MMMMAARRSAARVDASRRRRRNHRRSPRGDIDENLEISICCCPKNSWFSRPHCKTDIKYSIISSLLCVILITFVIYDLVQIARFEQQYADCARAATSTSCKLTNDFQRHHRTLQRRHEGYIRQRAMAIALLLLLLLLIAASVLVHVGCKLKRSGLLLPYLILTFPLLTVTMIYAILFRAPDAGAVVYIKIISVVVIYTVLANVFRGTYRLYRTMRLGTARANRDLSDVMDQAYNVSGQLEPVVIQMKPPPYEKEPPAYSLYAPDISSPPYTAHPSPKENSTTETEFGAPPYTPAVTTAGVHVDSAVQLAGVHRVDTRAQTTGARIDALPQTTGARSETQQASGAHGGVAQQASGAHGGDTPALAAVSRYDVF